MNTFRSWVKSQGGPTRVAAMLGVTRQSVNNWLHGRSKPGLPTIFAINAISGGKVKMIQGKRVRK